MGSATREMKGHERLKVVNSRKVIEKLVTENMALVPWVWGRIKHRECFRFLGYDDAISAGNMGLFRAAELFDRKRGLAFSTYAFQWIQQAIHREVLVGKRHTPMLLLSQIAASKGDDAFEDTFAGSGGLDDTTAAMLRDSLQRLRPRYRQVVEMRFFDGRTLTECGELMGGISRERIRQLENQALKQLRGFMGDGES